MTVKEIDKNEGITLIALVVTIIVLLILAGISIQMITGQSGILSQAQEAQQRTELAKIEEEQKIEQMEQLIENNGEAPNTLEDFTKNPDKYQKPDSQTETDDVGISEDGKVIDMDLWNYEIDEETESFELVALGMNSGLSGVPSFTFIPDGKGGYEGIKITTDSEGKKIAEFIGGMPTYLRTNNKIYILKAIGEGAFTTIIPRKMLGDNPSEFFSYLAVDFDEIKINIPDTVKEIKMGGFGTCLALKEIKIPKNVTNIGLSAFYGCSNLENIIISNSVIDIDNWAFCQCTKLTKINIPTGISDIYPNIFNGCTNLKEITIPENVKKIWRCAFDGCNSLSTINYRGTREKWGEINIVEEGNDALKNANINYEYKD